MIIDFEIGQTEKEKVVVTEMLIEEMAKISNDYNPIHMSDEFARNSIFGKRIAHGLVCEALVSSLIVNKLPGAGAIFLNISFTFRKPVFIEDTITVTGTIKSIDHERDIMILEIICNNQDDIIVTESIAEVKYIKIKESNNAKNHEND